MGNAIIWIVGLGAVALVLLLAGRRRSGPRRRREAALRQVATRLGFTYERNHDPFKQEPHLDVGLRRSLPELSRVFYGFWHAMSGSTSAGPVWIFDIWHGDLGGGGKSDAASPCKLTLAGFRLEGARLPEVRVAPESKVQKFGDAVFKPLTDAIEKKWRDIDFTTHPEFSDRYSLRSSEEAETRALFAPSFLEFWESLPPDDRFSAATAGDSIVVYRLAKWKAGREREVAPDDIEAFVRGAERIALAFRQAADTTRS
jgi:hypothetical protein